MIEENDKPVNRIENVGKARLSVILFLLATVLIVLFGSIPSMRPVFEGTPVGILGDNRDIDADHMCAYPYIH